MARSGSLADIKRAHDDATLKREIDKTAKAVTTQKMNLAHLFSIEEKLFPESNRLWKDTAVHSKSKASNEFAMLHAQLQAFKPLHEKYNTVESKKFFADFEKTYGITLLKREDQRFKNNADYEAYLRTYYEYVLYGRQFQDFYVEMVRKAKEPAGKTLPEQLAYQKRQLDYCLALEPELNYCIKAIRATIQHFENKAEIKLVHSVQQMIRAALSASTENFKKYAPTAYAATADARFYQTTPRAVSASAQSPAPAAVPASTPAKPPGK